MTDLFLEPKVLDYNEDRYELILYTLRLARQLKAKGSAEPMADLINKALREIVEKRITKEEIMAKPAPVPAPAPDAIPAPLAVAEEGAEGKLALAADDAAEDEDKKGKAKKKAKKKED